MAGIWPHSLLQQHDAEGVPIAGALAYFFEAGTSTPLDTFSDYGLTTEHTHPVEADGLGRFPAVYLDDGTYRVRLTDADGVQIFDVDGIPVVGASDGGEGGGGGTTFDATALLDTGDMVFSTKTGARSGFVRANGRTIGSATSGASERAHADTQPLFEHLWTNLPNALAGVSGGRGASGAADFAANKTLALPDLRGRALFGVDSMGSSAAGRLTASKVAGGSADAVGGSGGSQDETLVTANLPSHTHTFTTGAGGAHTHTASTASGGSHTHTASTSSSGAHTHDLDVFVRDLESGAGEEAYADGGAGSDTLATESSGAHTHTVTVDAGGAHTHDVTVDTSATHTHTGTTAATGSGTAVDIMPPFALGTVYVRL
jgi:hypothetical protein